MKEQLKHFTLLYAEDDEILGKNMLEYFSTYFEKVYYAKDGNEALELYKTYKPNVMILDIYMPKLDGMKLAELVKKNDFKTKIVIFSAHSQSELLLEAIKLSISYYLIKPANLTQIKEMLDKLAQELMRDNDKFIRLDQDTVFLCETKKLLHHHQEIVLTYKESRLLELFLKHKGEAIPINTIMNVVWEEEYMRDISIDSVKSQVSNLRKKIPHIDIKNIYGIGYMIKLVE